MIEKSEKFIGKGDFFPRELNPPEMLTLRKRELMDTNALIKNDAVGYDCYGKFLKIGDTIEIIRNYVKKDQKGTISNKNSDKNLMNLSDFYVEVDFTDKKGKVTTVKCLDIDLRNLKKEE
jgi:hypothetical protein